MDSGTVAKSAPRQYTKDDVGDAFLREVIITVEEIMSTTRDLLLVWHDLQAQGSVQKPLATTLLRDFRVLLTELLHGILWQSLEATVIVSGNVVASLNGRAQYNPNMWDDTASFDAWAPLYSLGQLHASQRQCPAFAAHALAWIDSISSWPFPEIASSPAHAPARSASSVRMYQTPANLRRLLSICGSCLNAAEADVQQDVGTREVGNTFAKPVNALRQHIDALRRYILSLEALTSKLNSLWSAEICKVEEKLKMGDNFEAKPADWASFKHLVTDVSSQYHTLLGRERLLHPDIDHLDLV